MEYGGAATGARADNDQELTEAGVTRRATLGAASVAAYLIAVALVELLRRAEVASVGDLAATPDAVADLKLWVLVTSAFIVSGPPVLELLGVAIAAVLLVRRRSAGTFWACAVTGHIGGTLLVYGSVGVLWLASHETVQSVLDRPDYGVSAVWLALLGALLVCAIDAVRAGRPSSIDRLLIVACPLAALIGFAFFPLLSGSEHLVAFLTGMLVARIFPG